ncbi:hypothetical protein CI109_105131 [Kwoniella shandongensis]|uniref:sphingolipid 4-desaturase n=1 Tax=Kwoniella shandongensis TaxID=1734106 RepID=A0A5M6C7X2_9TREE|nr:uncharacterized protein CI109_001970 [Kwoniella shandongensis]KAA5529545.1 hypothetical protein CI109_001970 [Kwoniella shandongensis]
MSSPVVLPLPPINAASKSSKPVTRRTRTGTSTTSTSTIPSSTSSPELSSCDPSDQESVSADEKNTVKEEEDPFPDFLWMTTEEPHRSRRIAILKAHPEVRKLMGPTSATFPLVLFVLAIQISLAIYFRNSHPLSFPFLLTAYIIGGTCNQNIFLAIHEITHNLAFKSIKANKLLAIVANFSIGVPYAMAFKGYHIEHHKFLGEDGIDTDLPSRVEALVLNNVAGKTFFATFQLLFYAIRPGFIRAQTFTKWHALNLLAVISFDLALIHFSGVRSWLYLVISSFFAGSLHPCAAHFIAEHYLMEGPLPIPDEQGGDEDILMKGLAQETTSYYGPLNILCYNVGYHNEHHDFPSVPWTRLPQLRAIASEFYAPLPSHASWPYVTWKFITDPSVGMWSRAKRTSKGEKIHENTWVSGAGAASKVGLEGEVVAQEDEEEEELGYASDRDDRKMKTK